MAGTLVKDPSTGGYTLSPDAGQAPLGDANGSASDPHTTFSLGIMDMLNAAKVAGNGFGNTAPLIAAKNKLTNESLNLSNPLADTPYATLFKGMTPEAQVGAERGTQAAFEPGITSLEGQTQAYNSATQAFTGLVNQANDISKPLSVPAGTSLIDRQGNVLYQGGKYAPTFNYQKGIMDGFDYNTGTWASDQSVPGDLNAHFGNADPQNPFATTGGVDFTGAATSTKPYATDPAYVQSVSSMYGQLSKAIPTPTAPLYDQYIQAHAGKAPVTGQLIINGANSYNLDPNILASVLAHESDFGTSEVASKNNNPGGIVFAGQPGASQGTPRPQNEGGYYAAFKSMQMGVNAVAEQLSRRVPTTKPGEPQRTESPVGGDFSDLASQKLSALPTWMQTYADAGPKGVAYINDDRVPANQKDAVKTFASKAGVPYVGGGDAQALKAIGVVYQSMDSMQELAGETLRGGALGQNNNSFLGTLEDSIRNPLAERFGTSKGVTLSKFNSFRDTAIKAVQALAGGAGSGLRINGAEIMANVQALPTTTDSLQTAVSKLDGLRSQLDKQLSATFPYVGQSKAPGGQSAAPQSGVTPGGRSYKVVSP